MGLLGEGRFSAVQPFDHRRRDRRGCDIGAAIIISHGELRARIFNISAGGIGFTIDRLADVLAGNLDEIVDALIADDRARQLATG